jgi:hypothetical protein
MLSSLIHSRGETVMHQQEHAVWEPVEEIVERFAIRTYLKLILVLVGNYYASQQDSRDLMMRSHDELGRLRPLFDHLALHYGDPIRVEDAARLSARAPPISCTSSAKPPALRWQPPEQASCQEGTIFACRYR